MIDFQERAWVQAARGGDQEAFAQLVHQYEARVLALTSRLCQNREDAVDAAQEAFLAAWQGLPSYRGDASFSTWLYRLSSNACIDLLRRENRHRAKAGLSLDDESVFVDLPGTLPSPEAEAERSELRAQIEDGLQAMTPEHRQVLILRELEQLSYDEIASVLTLDTGTVKSRLNRARRQLRSYLLDHGNFSVAAASKEPEKEGCQ